MTAQAVVDQLVFQVTARLADRIGIAVELMEGCYFLSFIGLECAIIFSPCSEGTLCFPAPVRELYHSHPALPGSCSYRSSNSYELRNPMQR